MEYLIQIKLLVHPKTVKDRTRQDYTDYGLSIEDAVKFELGELNGGKPWDGQFLTGELRW